MTATLMPLRELFLSMFKMLWMNNSDNLFENDQNEISLT